MLRIQAVANKERNSSNGRGQLSVAKETIFIYVPLKQGARSSCTFFSSARLLLERAPGAHLVIHCPRGRCRYRREVRVEEAKSGAE